MQFAQANHLGYRYPHRYIQDRIEHHPRDVDCGQPELQGVLRGLAHHHHQQYRRRYWGVRDRDKNRTSRDGWPHSIWCFYVYPPLLGSTGPGPLLH